MHPTPPVNDGAPAGDGARTRATPARSEVGQSELREKVLRLRGSLTAVPPTQRSEPRGRGPRPIVPHRVSGLFDACRPVNVWEHLEFGARDTLGAGVIQLLIVHGVPAEQLGGSVAIVKERFELACNGGTVAADGPLAVVVTELLDSRDALPKLGGLVGEPELDIPLPHAAAVVRFLDTYPQFWQGFAAVCRLTFASSRADDMGGGLYDKKDGQVYISKMVVIPPEAFVRLVVHEFGHVMFERKLLINRPMPPALATDVLPDIDAGRLRLTSTEVQELQDYWNGMPQITKMFYRAWLTLRQTPAHLLGTDLWEGPAPRCKRLGPRERQHYQAGDFGEFCAETFMQYAMGDLHGHVMSLLADPDVPPAVQSAWRNAWSILEAVADQILGPRAKSTD